MLCVCTVILALVGVVSVMDDTLNTIKLMQNLHLRMESSQFVIGSLEYFFLNSCAVCSGCLQCFLAHSMCARPHSHKAFISGGGKLVLMGGL